MAAEREDPRFADADAGDYYTITSTVPSGEFTQPAYALLDEEKGGYVAFFTDQETARVFAQIFNKLDEIMVVMAP